MAGHDLFEGDPCRDLRRFDITAVKFSKAPPYAFCQKHVPAVACAREEHDACPLGPRTREVLRSEQLDKSGRFPHRHDPAQQREVVSIVRQARYRSVAAVSPRPGVIKMVEMLVVVTCVSGAP